MNDLVILYLLMLEKTKETLKAGNINIIEPPTLKKKGGGRERAKEKKEITVDVFQEGTCYAV